MSDVDDEIVQDPGEIRRLSKKELLKEKRRELYLKMKEKTAPARKAAYEKQKARYKAIQAEKKAKAKEAKKAEKQKAQEEKYASLRAAIAPAEGSKSHLRLVKSAD